MIFKFKEVTRGKERIRIGEKVYKTDCDIAIIIPQVQNQFHYQNGKF